MNQDDVMVSFYLKKSEANELGECPIMGRLNVGRYSEAAFSMKMTAPESTWLLGRATGKSVRSREINRQLDEVRASIFSIYQDLFALRENVSAEEVKCILLGMAHGQETLIAFFLDFIKKFEKKVGVSRVEGSAASYRYACKHLLQFLKDEYNLSDIPFTALDKSFIDKYCLHLRTDCHLGLGTILLLTTRLMTVVRKAISKGIITSNPFAGYEVERPTREIKYLTQNELERIMSTPLHNRKLYHIRDLFLFSCFTGIPYGDMCRLSDEDLIKYEDGSLWIKASRKKTKVVYEVPLLDVPLYILDKYRDFAPKGKLLPMYSNSEVNDALKVIADLCGIEQRLVFHCGRHTSATTVLLSNGVPLETVSKILGHDRISTTQIYAHVTDDKVESDTRMLDSKIAERFSVTI